MCCVKPNLQTKIVRNNLAYNLLELSIVITIISFVSLTTFNIYKTLKVKYEDNQLENKFNVIENALLKYYQKNLSLPLPDSFLNDHSNPDICNIISSVHQDGWFSYKDIIIGSVPTESLNLTHDYKLDNFSNKILYIINKNVACTKKLYHKTNLVIQDIAFKNITDDAMYLILSLEKSFNLDQVIKNHKLDNEYLIRENYNMDNIFIYSLFQSKEKYKERMKFKTQSLFFIDLALKKELSSSIKVSSYLSDLSCKCSNYSYSSKVNNIINNFCVQ
jgi:hypothetical protein